jgi:alpha-L-rhamnosidase
MRIKLSWLLSFLIVIISTAFAHADLTVTGLECEHLKNPLGIAAATPRLSWYSESAQRGEMQTAYQILVASSQDKLDTDEGDLWNGEKVDSDQSLFVKYAGKPLESYQRCFWKVRVWDKDGKPSPWSDTAKWSMGLLKPTDWHAKWIGWDEFPNTQFLSNTNWIWFPEGKPAESAPAGERFFRRTFSVPKDRQIKSATFRITADDRCSIFLNGRDIGSRSGPRTSKEMDLTSRIESGENVFAISAKNEGESPSPAGMIAWLRVEFTEGEPLTLITDDSWKVTDKTADGWSTRDFDDSQWKSAMVLGPAFATPKIAACQLAISARNLKSKNQYAARRSACRDLECRNSISTASESAMRSCRLALPSIPSVRFMSPMK